MFNQLDTRTLYIVQKDKERELEARIAMARAAKESAVFSGVKYETSQPWYAPVMAWMKTKLLHRAPVAQQVQEPCPTVPC